ncbi:MAG: M20/M25/M40 family metallo-hydrolase, partial [Chloroflexi bacterium]
MLSTLLSVLIVGFVLLLFLAALLIFRAMMYGRIPNEEAAVEVIAVEGPLVAEHLAAAIQVETISDLDHDKINLSALDHFHTILERQYPRLHATLQREKVSGYSLLYTWPGRAQDLDPVALLGHMDVVPVDPSTLAAWTHPPFSGVVADGMVWGRGTLDIKCTVITVMEAVESLIKAGYQPERTLYLGFGHDEEIGGLNGARCIVELLQQRGIQLAAVLDEGGAIMENIVPGMQLPVALLGVTEKGHASFELSVEGRAGHSSLPPRHTAIGVLARAIARLEERPMPENTKMVEMMFGEL